MAMGTRDQIRASTIPRVRQFLDRMPEPEAAEGLDSFEVLTGGRSKEEL